MKKPAKVKLRPKGTVRPNKASKRRDQIRRQMLRDALLDLAEELGLKMQGLEIQLHFWEEGSQHPVVVTGKYLAEDARRPGFLTGEL